MKKTFQNPSNQQLITDSAPSNYITNVTTTNIEILPPIIIPIVPDSISCYLIFLSHINI